MRAALRAAPSHPAPTAQEVDDFGEDEGAGRKKSKKRPRVIKSICYEILYEDGDTEDLTPLVVKQLNSNAVRQGFEEESDSEAEGG